MFTKHATDSLPQSYKWVILAMVWLVYGAFGLVSNSIAPLVTPIIRDLNMSYSQMGLTLGSWQLTYIAFALIGGTIIDKWGVRKSLFVGTITIGLSAALRYFSGGFISFLPIVALFGVGGPLISIGAPKAIAVWFGGKSRGAAVGIYMTAPRMAALFSLAGTNSLVMPLTGYSWRLTFVFYGFLIFIIASLWLWLARDTKTTGDMVSASISKVFGRLIKVRDFIVILVIGLLMFVIMHGFTQWLPKILENNGFSPETAGFAASISIAVGIPAVLVIPRVVPPRLRGKCIALLAVLVAAALVILANAAGYTLFIGLVSFGIAASSLLPLTILLLMDTPEVGSQYMGSAGGIFFCVAEIGGFTGPLLMGALVDMTGAFLVGTYFLAGLGLAIFAMTFFLKTPSVDVSEAP